MEKYQLRFWFEHAGPCIWAVNARAKEKYGYGMWNNDIPISAELIDALDAMQDEYGTYLNWDYPPDPSPWPEEQKIDFYNRATKLYERLKEELGNEYEISNEVRRCVT